MNNLRHLAAIGLFLGGLVVVGCSPEAARARNGGPGADTRNWGQPVEIHGTTNPAYRTPVVGEGIKK